MFSHIGRKLKALAIILAWCGIGVSVAAGLLMIFEFPAYDDMRLYGLLSLVAGPLVSWVSSWIVYGFGELIDRTAEIAKNTRPPVERSAAAPAQSEADGGQQADQRLLTLKSWLEKGILTESEYEAKRAAIFRENGIEV